MPGSYASCTSQESPQLLETLGRWKHGFHVLALLDICVFSFP